LNPIIRRGPILRELRTRLWANGGLAGEPRDVRVDKLTNAEPTITVEPTMPLQTGRVPDGDAVRPVDNACC
jgi:hypothetical protein